MEKERNTRKSETQGQLRYLLLGIKEHGDSPLRYLTHCMPAKEKYKLLSTYCYIGLKSETFCDRMINF